MNIIDCQTEINLKRRRVSDWDKNIGVDIGQLLSGTIPKPKWTKRWKEPLSQEMMQALQNSETIELLNQNNKPYSLLLMDHYGTIREKKYKEPSE
jgi:hypothetical protein